MKVTAMVVMTMAMHHATVEATGATHMAMSASVRVPTPNGASTPTAATATSMRVCGVESCACCQQGKCGGRGNY
jgi:hypothetical protein